MNMIPSCEGTDKGHFMVVHPAPLNPAQPYIEPPTPSKLEQGVKYQT